MILVRLVRMVKMAMLAMMVMMQMKQMKMRRRTMTKVCQAAKRPTSCTTAITWIKIQILWKFCRYLSHIMSRFVRKFMQNMSHIGAVEMYDSGLTLAWNFPNLPILLKTGSSPSRVSFAILFLLLHFTFTGLQRLPMISCQESFATDQPGGVSWSRPSARA